MVFANQLPNSENVCGQASPNIAILLPHTFRPPSPLVESLDTNFEWVAAPPQLGRAGLSGILPQQYPPTLHDWELCRLLKQELSSIQLLYGH